jgi:hypothetical protein
MRGNHQDGHLIPPHHGQHAGHDQGGKGADHVDFTMGKVDQFTMP